MKVYITKYALTEGITEKEVELCQTNFDMVQTKDGMRFNCYYHGEGKEWHRTWESAVARAEEMRQKKIKSVEKQLEKLKNMKFERKGEE